VKERSFFEQSMTCQPSIVDSTGCGDYIRIADQRARRLTVPNCFHPRVK
jgi:hypothetical protein